jgi:excisionase family DNA binding protein
MVQLEPFYTVKEAAKIARVSERTIVRAIRQRYLSVVRPVGCRRVLIPAVSLEVFLYGPVGAPMTTGRGVELETGLPA